MKAHITIVGTGLCFEDISPRALKVIDGADVLIGGKRQLAMFPGHTAEKIEIKKNAAELVKSLKSKLKDKTAVVLASGDPNFFGIAGLFYKHYPNDQLVVLPNITAFQGAFARIKEPWDSVLFVSVHGRSLSALNRILHENGMFVIYGDHENTPAKAAKYLIERNPDMGACRAWIFESLGSAAEKVRSGNLKKFNNLKTSGLSMMLLKKELSRESIPLGIHDSRFEHRKGLITKRDIRLIVLARLNLSSGQVLWDIGAGSGSVSIEAANLFPQMEIYAVEKDEKRYKELLQNIRRFKAFTVEPVFAQAPDVLKDLPAPQSVFIGGTGGELQAIATRVKDVLSPAGHVVVNCVTMDTLNGLLALFKKWRWRYDITSVQISSLSSDMHPEILRAENPVFVVHGCK
ncbi:MAG: precorrin-6y C5,15-methyltransferase (decarboxylating) subunit CbiE [Pseudomonadota bacterium]